MFAKTLRIFDFFESALGVMDNLKNHLYARKRSETQTGPHMRGVRAFPMLVNKNVLSKKCLVRVISQTDRQSIF